MSLQAGPGPEELAGARGTPSSVGWVAEGKADGEQAAVGGGQESPEQLPCTRHCFRPCSKHNSKIPSLCIFCPLSSCSWSSSPGYAQSSLPRAQSPLFSVWAAPGGAPRWGPAQGQAAGRTEGCQKSTSLACKAQGSCLLTVSGSRSP